MQTLIESLNAVAETWAECLWGVLWQSTILILVAGLLAGLFLRRSSPALRYWVWQILAIKLLLMPFWTFAIPLSQMSASRQMEPADEAPLVAVIDDDSTSSSSARNKNSAAAGMPGAAQSSDRPSAIKRVAWQSWLFLGWLAIVSAHVVRLVWQRSRLNRLLRRAIPADERLCELVRETAARLELRHAPPAMFTDVDCSPFVCNMRRAVLVMPRALTARLSPAELRHVLLHELAHVRRLDLVWGWTGEIARVVYFFHPLAHWLCYRMRLERELACDTIAMSLSGQNASEYVATLVRVISHASEPTVFKTAAASAGLDGGAS